MLSYMYLQAEVKASLLGEDDVILLFDEDSNGKSALHACGTCPFALLWLPVIADFRVTFFPYISLYERPRGNLKFTEYF